MQLAWVAMFKALLSELLFRNLQRFLDKLSIAVLLNSYQICGELGDLNGACLSDQGDYEFLVLSILAKFCLSDKERLTHRVIAVYLFVVFLVNALI